MSHRKLVITNSVNLLSLAEINEHHNLRKNIYEVLISVYISNLKSNILNYFNGYLLKQHSCLLNLYINLNTLRKYFLLVPLSSFIRWLKVLKVCWLSRRYYISFHEKEDSHIL